MNKTQLGYPTLPDTLHKKIFGTNDRETIPGRAVARITNSLSRFGIKVPVESSGDLFDKDLPIPALRADTLKEHFEKIAEDQIGGYMVQGENMASCQLPEMPPAEILVMQDGWTRYAFEEGEWFIDRVAYPLEPGFCFDTETYVNGGNFPIIGTALSDKAYYLWLAPELLDPSLPYDDWGQFKMIPVGTKRFIFGHNISFDRIRSREAYSLDGSGPENFFFDTLSAHVGVSGLASGQRWIHAIAGKDFEMLTEEEKRILRRKPKWFFQGSTNSLVACYNYHVASQGSFFKDQEPLDESDKEVREIFVKATNLSQITGKLEECVVYALKDVFYTTQLFQQLWPKYKNATPSLVGFCGHHHLNGSVVPLVDNWNGWIKDTEKVYESHISEMTAICSSMMKSLLNEWMEADREGRDIIESDPWYSQLDWTVKVQKGKYAGIPNWAREFIKDPDTEIGVRSRLAHLLLKLEWENSPIEWTKGDGWCYMGQDFVRRKIPHPKGNGANVGGLFSKDFVKDMEVGRLSSSLPEAKRALEIANAISYWTSVRGRVMSRIPVKVTNPYGKDTIITLPEILCHGTLTRRTVESLMITMCSTKAWRIGTELKTRVVAPDGWKVVGADFDGQEMTIAAIYADMWDGGYVGCSPLGYRVLSGSKAEGTDPHTALAKEITPEVFEGVSWVKGEIFHLGEAIRKDKSKELSLARDLAKIVGFSILYGSGVHGVKTYIRKFYPEKTDEEVFRFARRAITAKKGQMDDGIYFGGSDSGAFNKMEEIAIRSRLPQLPCLGTKISTALRPEAVGADFKTGRTNWAIQASGAEILSIFLTAIHWLSSEFKIPFRFVLSIHDEIWCIAPEKMAEQFAVLYQMAHMLTWALFSERTGMKELPISRAYFSGVAIDDRLRKSVKESTVSPSNPNGDSEPAGKEYTIADLDECGAISKLTTKLKMIEKGLL